MKGMQKFAGKLGGGDASNKLVNGKKQAFDSIDLSESPY
jgi:hypothetical protein